jgi:5'-nucleotidase
MSRAWWLPLILAGCGSPHSAPHATGIATVHLLAFNDFHGQLDADADGRGGAAGLAGEIAALRTPGTLVVAAGDLIGGSPLDSGLYHDMPAIAVLNAMGLDLSSVGNHEFDEGDAELQRMQHGGCHPLDGCIPGESFPGAAFPYLAANVVDNSTGATIFPPYAIRDVDGVRVAFVGETLENTPAETLASAIPELRFGDEVDTLDALVPELHAAGAQVIVLLIHQGGAQLGGPNDCTFLTGAIVDLATRLDGVVPLVVSGHTHQSYVCQQGSVLVTSAGARGALLTEITLQVDRGTGTVRGAVAVNHPIDATVTPDPTVAALVGHYDQIVAPRGDRVIATIRADVSDVSDANGESPMGDVVTDAMRAGTGADVALMNAGGIRGPLLYAASGSETADGQVTYAEAFTVQPFGNLVETGMLSGADLIATIDVFPGGHPTLISGAAYTWSASAPAGQEVVPTSVTVGGAPIDLAASYRVAVNSIVVQGAPSWASATGVVGAGVDLDLLTAYLTAGSPLAPPAPGRITRAP